MHASHRHTDEYMARMYGALEDMGVDTADDMYRDAFDPACSTVGAAAGQPAVQRSPSQRLPRGTSTGSAASAAAIAALPSSGWQGGPSDTAGRVANLSDRNLLCMSVHGSVAVVGSADHGLLEVELQGSGRDNGPLRPKRTLYTKQYGHSEWVTDVTHLPDGRILSAGMDSKVCLWNAAGAPRCIDLVGHTGSIARVLGSADGSLALSAGYDKTVRLWSTQNGAELAKLRAHRAPVLHVAWAPGVLASADREGSVVLWDVHSGTATPLGAHGGHATALAATGADGGSTAAGGTGLLSGGQDGVVRLWDVRQERSACETQVHTGAVNELVAHRLASSSPLVLSGGADKRVLALDPRMSLQAVHVFEEHRDHIYSLTAIGDLCVSGAGDGLVLVHGLGEGKCLCAQRPESRTRAPPLLARAHAPP
jgi:WD40 repeat protein